jgi:hypothetical protein
MRYILLLAKQGKRRKSQKRQKRGQRKGLEQKREEAMVLYEAERAKERKR